MAAGWGREDGRGGEWDWRVVWGRVTSNSTRLVIERDRPWLPLITNNKLRGRFTIDLSPRRDRYAPPARSTRKHLSIFQPCVCVCVCVCVFVSSVADKHPTRLTLVRKTTSTLTIWNLLRLCLCTCFIEPFIDTIMKQDLVKFETIYVIQGGSKIASH